MSVIDNCSIWEEFASLCSWIGCLLWKVNEIKACKARKKNKQLRAIEVVRVLILFNVCTHLFECVRVSVYKWTRFDGIKMWWYLWGIIFAPLSSKGWATTIPPISKRRRRNIRNNGRNDETSPRQSEAMFQVHYYYYYWFAFRPLSLFFCVWDWFFVFVFVFSKAFDIYSVCWGRDHPVSKNLQEKLTTLGNPWKRKNQ